jgi:hypothetical protein
MRCWCAPRRPSAGTAKSGLATRSQATRGEGGTQAARHVAGLVRRLAFGLHERSDSLEKEVSNRPWRLPDVDATSPSPESQAIAAIRCLGWVCQEPQAFAPPLPLPAWQNDRFDEHSRILGGHPQVGRLEHVEGSPRKRQRRDGLAARGKAVTSGRRRPGGRARTCPDRTLVSWAGDSVRGSVPRGRVCP